MISFSKLIIRITFILVVGTGIAAYVKLEWFRNFVDEIKNEYFLPKEAPFPIAESRRPKLIYLIADERARHSRITACPKWKRVGLIAWSPYCQQQEEKSAFRTSIPKMPITEHRFIYQYHLHHKSL